MAGWQWAFVITGLLGLALAVLVFFCLPDWPDSPPSRRQFLSPDEAAFMVARLPPNASKIGDKNFDWQAIKADLKDGLLCEYLCLSCVDRLKWILSSSIRVFRRYPHACSSRDYRSYVLVTYYCCVVRIIGTSD